uniref:RF_PROK_I domain-containing protein n=1 Tax=Heterorhabditis bacteriophora TaxID=37862 RepID=A0A1I7WMZ9_HETBA
MFRLSLRIASSSYRSILTGENANLFLRKVDGRLSQDIGEQPGELVSYWKGISLAAQKMNSIKKDIEQLDDIVAETSDSELRSLATEERNVADSSFNDALNELAKCIVPSTELDVMNKCQVEFTSGAGGQEAMLFAGELMEMYRRYSEWRGWRWDNLQIENSDIGGIRSAIIAVSGQNVYSALRFEAGIHRVQRIPITDKSRMHTSTVSVSVLPEPEEIYLPCYDFGDSLFDKDFDIWTMEWLVEILISVVVPTQSVKIETMRASGPGGQNVNKRSTAVRITHKETGTVVHCMDERFQHLNIQVIAFKRLAAILMQRKVDGMSEKFNFNRKLQVGSKARAEKIRTYNFQHDRVSDHRINLQIGNLEEFMKGQQALHRVVEKLSEVHMTDRLAHIVNNCVLE